MDREKKKKRYEELLHEIKKRYHKNLWTLVPVFVLVNMFFHDLFVYSKRFPEIYKTQTWQEHAIHKTTHFYNWAISWISNPIEIPSNYLIAYSIFTGFWMFLIFLMILEPYLTWMLVWEEEIEKQGFSKKDFGI